jgi:hypothetical protein
MGSPESLPHGRLRRYFLVGMKDGAFDTIGQ